MVLGHEVVGTVVSYGPEATGSPPRVRRSPCTRPPPCGHCPECADGRANVCRDTRYLGSAARFPHVQGGFAARLVVACGAAAGAAGRAGAAPGRARRAAGGGAARGAAGRGRWPAGMCW
ncbi:alcohol dehydrogenase catalytic domain-containing protein [Streptomyces tricolor]|nr:alcohol dehydrogenase catalytic domain-containing protein [Streptomyces tricolor]